MEEEIDLKELFDVLWKKKWIIILVTILFAGIGAYYTMEVKVPYYKSSTTLLLAQNSSQPNSSQEFEIETNEITQTDITLNQGLVSTYSVLVKSKTVVSQVLQNLNMQNANENDIIKKITVKAVEGTQVIEITYASKDATTAYLVVNELAKVFCEKVTEIYNINNVYIVDKAELATTPYNINHTKDILIFFIAGAGLSCVAIFVISLFDTTVKSQRDIEEKTGLVVLAQIPFEKTGGNK